LLLKALTRLPGDLAEAKNSCAKLAALRPGVAASACAASIGSATGESEKS
jgi:hypothetical protein